MNALPNPFLPDPPSFDALFDADAFMSAIGINPLPVFISDPSDEYLTAVELLPIVEVLTQFR